MKTLTALVIGAAIALGSCKDDSDDNKRSVSDPDRSFAMNAGMANRAEIDLAQLAADRSSNAAVESFASHMISEHTTALNELAAIVDKTNVVLSTDLDAEHQALKAKLTALSGVAFDTVYVNSQVKDHHKAIALFQAESTNGMDAELKAYATKNLPHLNEHLATAIQLQSSVMADADNNGRKNND